MYLFLWLSIKVFKVKPFTNTTILWCSELGGHPRSAGPDAERIQVNQRESGFGLC